MTPAPTGIVLTGGRSRRMGVDKAFVAHDGRPLVVRVSEALRAGGCDRVECQGGDVARLTGLGLAATADTVPGRGPVAAIAEALDRVGGPIVVAACDLPALDGATVRAVIAAGSRAGAPAVAAAQGYRHLVSYWPVAALGVLRGALEGQASVSYRAAVASADAVEVDVDPALLRNVNAPDDL